VGRRGLLNSAVSPPFSLAAVATAITPKIGKEEVYYSYLQPSPGTRSPNAKYCTSNSHHPTSAHQHNPQDIINPFSHIHRRPVLYPSASYSIRSPSCCGRHGRHTFSFSTPFLFSIRNTIRYLCFLISLQPHHPSPLSSHWLTNSLRYPCLDRFARSYFFFFFFQGLFGILSRTHYKSTA